MPTRPLGTITFLLTDIEGSTRLWERYPAAMGAALARHDHLLRAAIEEHGGRVFKTGGDTFYAAFGAAPNALAAALAAQRALHAEAWGELGPLRVRMALHTDSAEERAGDYFGPALNRVARLLAAGHGGQILLSRAVAELVRDGMPPGAALRDLGEHRLRDLARSEHLFQLVVPDLPATFAPLRSLEAFAHNLPLQLTSFIGREREMADLKWLLAEAPTRARLLTLTGVGGTGKTRLSLQAAAGLVDAFADGIWFVELAPLADPALLAQAIATALGVRIEGSRPLLDALLDTLRPKQLLLILDNCEHLIDACARLVERLLRECPAVQILASSRETLDIAGEVVWPVPSLALPDQSQPLEALTQYEAVRLFIERAVAVDPTFAVTRATAPAIAEICHRLDGIPLAIELAAARVRALQVQEIERRLDDRFRLLTGGNRTALPRQQTLRALIDWSYDLLPHHEQLLLCRLSTFAGGWTLAAAEAVCAGDPLDAADVLDLLLHLVNKSLVVVERGQESRYRLLETIRHYARAKQDLQARGEGEALRERHLAFYLRFGEETMPHLASAARAAWLRVLALELDNVRAALEWALTDGRGESGLRLAVAWFPCWDGLNIGREARDWLLRLLARPEVAAPTALRGHALSLAGGVFVLVGELAAGCTLFEEALAIGRKLDAPEIMILALDGLGWAAHLRADVPLACALYEQALTLARPLEKPAQLALLTARLGRVIVQTGDFERAAEYYRQALTLNRTAGYESGIAQTLNLLGEAILTLGDEQAARGYFEESLTIQRTLANTEGAALVLNSLGELARTQGNWEQALAYYREAIASFRQLGVRWWVSSALQNMGFTLLWLEEVEEAATVFQESLIMNQTFGDMVGLSFSLMGAAKIALMMGESTRAATLLGASSERLDGLGYHMQPIDQQEYDRILVALRARLAPADLERAWATGAGLATEQVVREAEAQLALR